MERADERKTGKRWRGERTWVGGKESEGGILICKTPLLKLQLLRLPVITETVPVLQ